MKYFATTTLMVLLVLTTVTSFAQEHSSGRTTPVKPSLFNKFPDAIACSTEQLNGFFDRYEGDSINVSFGNTLMLEGAVKSHISRYGKLQTVVVKLSRFNNILFTLSKTTDQENQVAYAGHLFDQAYADGYELKKISREKYQFVKIEMAKILPACNQ